MSLVHELQHFAKTLSVLVVEDDKTINSELVNILSIFFSSVDFAYDGKEGLAKYKINNYDIVLSDISMPEMDGITMSREIKDICRNQPIIILSSHSEANFMIDLIDVGVSQYMLKPIDKKILTYRLLKVSENIIYEREFKKYFKQESKNRLELMQNKKAKVKDQIKAKAQAKEQAVAEAKAKNSVEIKDIKTVNNTEKQISSDNYYTHEKEDSSNFIKDIQNDDLIWQAFKDDIPELLKLSEDFGELVEKMYLTSLNEDIRDEIVSTINGYINIFSTLDQMAKMTEVLSLLIEFLNELDIDSLTEKQQKKLKILEFISNDIARFLETLFVYQDTVDIYYLEDSLESSINQMRNDVLGIEVEEEEFELF